MGGGKLRRAGEYARQRELTILVIRDILLFDEQMKLSLDFRHGSRPW